MAQGDFTKEEARRTVEAVEELFNAIPSTRRLEYIGHLNDIMLFLHSATYNAPEEKEPKP